MLSVVIATHESERTLVPTLAALVPGATAGLVSEVIVADAGSRDATAEVADIAGCRFIAFDAPLGVRLKAAAAAARMPWLLFLHAGCVPEPAWVGAAAGFIQAGTGGTACAAVFSRGVANRSRSGLAAAIALLRIGFGSGAKAGQGLLICRSHYDEVGGHPDGAKAEDELLLRIGRRRLAVLAAGIRPAHRDNA